MTDSISNPIGLPSINMNLPAISKSGTGGSAPAAESLFSNHLASALSTISDSQYFQDSISPSTIRTNLTSPTLDPSNPSSTPTLLKSMKWLLASMSKGRNVSDFFPHVVKLVTATSLEVRKMVYMYLVHYADHDDTCRELALLSINSFQRGLSDSEQWIRALALRVLTSIRVMDVLQIQIMAVGTCARDRSPYVRKCAANALSKLYPRTITVDNENSTVSEDGKRLVEMLINLLTEEQSTMVLTSIVSSFTEMCPNDLHLLHSSYRKLCHLLTDMDEWGQIVVMDVLSRYCRKFFRKPGGDGGEEYGSAEVIDRERRVVRKITNGGVVLAKSQSPINVEISERDEKMKGISGDDGSNQLLPNTSSGLQKRTKRRIVKKAFYSDEEDESCSEDDVKLQRITPRSSPPPGAPSLASTMRQRNVLGFGSGITGIDHNNNKSLVTSSRLAVAAPILGGQAAAGGTVADATGAVDEDQDLDEDHRLLLRSSLPLLKSRNAGVVLGVCSLHYYCGVASIRIRSALGKALVRIYRDRREIQYVVLESIRTLVWECPSAFTPYLNDFFVKAMDPSFTRLIKLDILTALALEPNSINAVLKELRSYIRHNDKTFVCASIKCVSKITDLARIVYDRHGANEQRESASVGARRDANEIALNCLHGLLTLTESSDYDMVVGECVSAIQRILLLLSDGTMSIEAGDNLQVRVDDPNHVQSMALRRLVLLAVRTLTSVKENEDKDNNDDNLMSHKELIPLEEQVICIPIDQIGSAIWIIGEWLSTNDNTAESKQKLSTLHIHDMSSIEKEMVGSELLRLVAKRFLDMNPAVKLQSLHLASKMLLSIKGQDRSGHPSDNSLVCEHILGMGRVDINQDVRDRARFESNVLQMAVGLQEDTENLIGLPKNSTTITIDNARSMLLRCKPSSSWLPIESEDTACIERGRQNTVFRFGTLSSMIGHKAGNAYLPLPAWAEIDSPKSLREPIENPSSVEEKGARTKSKFYESEEDSSSTDSDSDSSETSSEESSTDSSEDSDSSDDEEESTSSSEEESTSSESASLNIIQPMVQTQVNTPKLNFMDETNGDPSSSSGSEWSSDSDETSEEEGANHNHRQNEDLIESLVDISATKTPNPQKSPSTLVSGLEGLVMAPVVVDKNEGLSTADIDNESSDWKVVVRHDLSGGLGLSIRFLRGSSRDREARLSGLDPKNPAVVCVQMKIENRRSDNKVIRRIRIIERNSNSSGIISTTRISLPQVIESLKTSEESSAILGLEFKSSSDKDGTLLCRFDVKSDRGTSTIDIRPSLGELLQPSGMSTNEFDCSVKRYNGIHQRTTGTITLPAQNLEKHISNVPARVMKVANLKPIETKISPGEDEFKFMGRLPASNYEVFIVIKFGKQTTTGELLICCDNAMAMSSLFELLKNAVTNC